MSRRGPNYHPSHKPRQVRLPARTIEGIAARNRAWRELCRLLPLDERYLRADGEVVR